MAIRYYYLSPKRIFGAGGARAGANAKNGDTPWDEHENMKLWQLASKPDEGGLLAI